MTDPLAPTPVGLTRDVGWELGVRRTLPVSPERLWRHLVGAGLATWLGAAALPAAKGERYETGDRTRGELRSLRPGHRIRLTWQPAGWSHDSTLQLTVLPARSGAVLAVHQERLASADERQALLAHWREVIGRLAVELGVGAP